MYMKPKSEVALTIFQRYRDLEARKSEVTIGGEAKTDMRR